MRLSVVIPCFNEEKNIPLILDRFDEVIEGRDMEVVVVNNGSTDNTAAMLSELIPKYPFAKTVLVPINKGYGYGILEGLKEATGDYVGWTHADMQTDPMDVIKAYELIEKKTEEKVYVKGDRKGRPILDQVFTNCMSIFETVYFGTYMRDINAQPNIFPKSFFEAWENPPYDFSLDLFSYFMAKKTGIKIVRFPVRFPERIHGESKWNNEGLKSKKKFIKRTMEFSIELKKRVR